MLESLERTAIEEDRRISLYEDRTILDYPHRLY